MYLCVTGLSAVLDHVSQSINNSIKFKLFSGLEVWSRNIDPTMT